MLFEDVVSINSITTITQNAMRLRSGKMSKPTMADDSVEWVLRACMNLPKLNLKIVPVSIQYDRLFESSQLTNEIISGKLQDLNLF
jgi:glycerol-3-phosphate O-acyltransferase